jgi:hypothetical protein
MRTICRQALFEDAWTRPLSKIAPEFGLTDVGLRKICSRNGIPTPSRGYWTKVAAGKVFPRPRLGPAISPEREAITIVPTLPVRPQVKAAVERVRSARPAPVEATVEPEIQPSTGMTAAVTKATAVQRAEPQVQIHRLAQRTQTKLASARGTGLVTLQSKRLFKVTATPAQAERVGLILTAIAQGVEAMGWRIEDSDKGFILVPDGEPAELEITERTDRVKHMPTEAEQAALRKHEEARQRAARRREWFSDWDRPRIPEWDRVPNGLLTLNLAKDTYLPNAVRRKFSDNKHQRIERMIDQVIESLAAYAASVKALRERRERERLGAPEGALAAFLERARDWAVELREVISNETLRRKLEHFDLMNDQASIGSWLKVE